ncbi:MAG TPA: CARDB domain-containing protein [Verrucomicrobiae bacterium]|nr:CARDB domain-containing protein [Verrucomicrobiae bacterium]
MRHGLMAGGLGVLAAIIPSVGWAATSSAESNIITVDTRGTGTLTVTGRVLNRATGLGLSGATVTLAGRSTTSGSSGTFSMANVDLGGGNTLEASASGFLSQARTVIAGAGVLSVTVGDLSLDAASTTVPVVEWVKPDIVGLYLFGWGFTTTVRARVNWNGNTPGVVRFFGNGTLMGSAGGAGPEYSTTMEVDNLFTPSLHTGVNTVRVVAEAAGGASGQHELNIAVLSAPTSLVAFLVPGYQSVDGAILRLKVEFPAPALRKTVSLPVIGEFGGKFQAVGEFQYSIAKGEWEMKLGGQGSSAEILVGDYVGEVGIAAEGKGAASLSRGITLDELSLVASLGLAADVRLGAYGLPDLLGPGLSTWLYQIPWLRPALDNVVVVLMIRPSLTGDAAFDLVPALAFGGAELTGKLPIEGMYEPNIMGQKVRFYVGGEPRLTFQIPGDLFKEVGFRLYAGTKVRAWHIDWTKEFVFVDYSFASEPGRRLPLTGIYDLGNGYLIEAAGNKTAAWRPMGREYLADGPEVFLPAPSSPGRRLSSAQEAALAAQEVFARMGAASSPGAVHLPAAGPGRRISSDTNLPAQAELPLLENVFPESAPAMAGKGDELMLLYVRDTGSTSNPVQFTEIAWTRFDGAAWGAPSALAATNAGQFAPAVAFDGNGDAVAAWEQCKDPSFSETNNLSALAAQMEIQWSRWDASAGTWVPMDALTDNACLDRRPQIAGPLSDGDLLLAWTRNEANAMIGEGPAGSTSNSCVLVARWDSATATWGVPEALVTNLTGELSGSLTAAGDRAVYCWTRDMDGDLDDTADTELFYRIFDAGSGLWGAAVRHTTDAVADRNARVAVDGSGAIYPVWQRGGDLVIDRGFAGSPSSVRPDSTTMGFADFALTVGPGDNVLVLWGEMTDAGSDAHYRVYDPASATWGEDTLLSHDSELERDFAPVWDAVGNLTLAYNNVIVSNVTKTVALEGGGTIDVPGVPQPGRVDLYAGKRAIVKDLTIGTDGFVAEGNDFLPGDGVTLTATVRNSGNVAVENVAVSFYDGDPGSNGTLIGGGVVSGWLRAGDTQSVTSAWTVPSPAVARTLFAVADPAGAVTEFDEANNVQSVSVNGVDLELSLLERAALRDGSVRVVAQVKNLSAPASPVSMLAIYGDGGTSNLLASVEVSVLSPGELVQIPIDLPAGTQPEGDRSYRLAVDDEGLSGDIDSGNNTVLFSVNLFIDDDGDGIPRSYEEANGMSDSDPADADLDVDGDGFNGKQEYLAGTNPRDPNSALKVGQLNVIQNISGDGLVCTVSWASVSGRLYRVERSFDLKQWDVVADNVDPTPPLNTINDEVVPKPARVFYRIVVK